MNTDRSRERRAACMCTLALVDCRARTRPSATPPPDATVDGCCCRRVSARCSWLLNGDWGRDDGVRRDRAGRHLGCQRLAGRAATSPRRCGVRARCTERHEAEPQQPERSGIAPGAW